MSSRKRFAKHVYRDIIIRQAATCACGCDGFLIPGVSAVEFNHIVALSEGGKDEPENLEAVLAKCHKRITARQARSRGKVRRIKLKDGLRTKGKNAKEKRLEKIRQWERMP